MNAVPAHGGNGGDPAAGDGPVGLGAAGALPAGADPLGVPAPAAAATRPLSRRRFLRAAGFTAAAAPLGGVLAACGGGSSASTANREVRIGYVVPQTGSLSEFADIENFTVGAMQDYFAQGVMVGPNRHPLRIVVRDSQSDPARAAQAASDLIFKDQVDVVIASATSATTNPVADQCEANGVPCVTTATPWESWFYGRGQPKSSFAWTYHVFWGMADLARVYRDMWDQVPGGTNKKVGLLVPEDVDGDQMNNTFQNLLADTGYSVQYNARFTTGEADLATRPPALSSRDVDILAGIPSPVDFNTFWVNASHSDTSDTTGRRAYFSPKVVTVSKALIFQSDVLALGSVGGDLGTEVSWSPDHPFRSSLTGITASKLANDYTGKSGNLWAQTLGFSHVLFEVVTKALSGITSIDDKASIARAIAGVRNYNSIVGEISFGGGSNVPRNVARTPLVGGQWQKPNSGGAATYNLVITTSSNQLIRATHPLDVITPADQGRSSA